MMKQKSWILKKINKGVSSVVFSICDYSSSCIDQWGDWLFYANYEMAGAKLNNVWIKGYNIKTNKFVLLTV